MEKLKRHWTERNAAAFVNRIAFDFVTQIQKRMEQVAIRNKDLARMLGITPSAVSQTLNSPGNLSIVNAVEYARCVGLKVALVAYDDGDPHNNNGPIGSAIFEQCWKLQGSPVDCFDLANITLPTCRVSLFHTQASTADEPWRPVRIDSQQLLAVAANTESMSVGHA